MHFGFLRHLNFIYSLAFRALVPFFLAIGVWCISYILVDESKLVSCSGTLDFSALDGYRSSSRNISRAIFSQNNLVFSLKSCPKPFQMENVAFTNSFYSLELEIKKAKTITVYYEKNRVEKSTLSIDRIVLDGKMVWNEWDYILNLYLFFVPFVILFLAWVWSIMNI